MTFNSVYEMLSPLTTYRLNHFWDWFDGNALRNWWNQDDFAGTGTTGIADAVDGGGFVTGGSGNNESTFINYDGKDQIDNNSSVAIFIFHRFSTGTNDFSRCGFVNAVGSDNQSAYVQDLNAASFILLRTGDASTSTDTDTTFGTDGVIRGYKMQLTSADCQLTVNGKLEITKTTNLPTVTFQPTWGGGNSPTGASGQTRLRYFEAYNT